MTYSTLDQPIEVTPIVFNQEIRSSGQPVNSEGTTKVVFIPDGVTPLEVYKAELLKAGYSKAHAKEIIEGLAESPLYEGTTS